MSSQAIRRAKLRTLRTLEREPWFMGVGITLEDSKPALVISVRKNKRSEAERVLQPLNLRVPVIVREVGRIRALPVAKKSSPPTPVAIAALKKAAQGRSGH